MEGINKRIVQIIDEQCDGNRSRFARAVNITPSYAAQLYADERIPSDRTISDICREFSVNETWLRTGEGEMFVSFDREKELLKFFKQLSGTPDNELDDFKCRLVSALSKLDEGAWSVLADLAKTLADTDKKNEG